MEAMDVNDPRIEDRDDVDTDQQLYEDTRQIPVLSPPLFCKSLDEADEKDDHGERKTHRLLYVPDPTRRQTKVEASRDMAWCKTTITHKQLEQVKDLTGVIHIISKRVKTDCVEVLVQEWVRIFSLKVFSTAEPSS
jgi:hypothetical protein